MGGSMLDGEVVGEEEEVEVEDGEEAEAVDGEGALIF